MSVNPEIPPLRIETERLVLRCWELSDAPLLKHAVESSLAHLRQWMPWAMQEPSDLEVVEERLERYRDNFLSGRDFVFGLFDPSECEVFGSSGLHTRVGPRALEIGYWIRADAIGRGLATEATRALTAAGLELSEIDRIEIHVDPENAPSVAIPRKLGYRHRETLHATKLNARGEARDTLIFELTSEEHGLSRATS